MFNKFDYIHMQCAHNWASLSHAKKKKVGAVIVTDKRCVSHGMNGTHESQPNSCEDKNGKTKVETIHAEMNAICFAAKHGIPLEGCTLYVTCAPCMSCIPHIASAGIKKIIYNEDYISGSNGTDLELARSYGLEICKLEFNELL